jgi:precorrin-6x reductase
MILLIGGTSETARLADGLAAAGYAVLVSTATDVPLAVGGHPRISRRTGRLDEAGLAALVREKGIQAIVDAAHPYAGELHATVQRVVRRLSIPCLTLRRPEAVAEEGIRRTGTAEADADESGSDGGAPAEGRRRPGSHPTRSSGAGKGAERNDAAAGEAAHGASPAVPIPERGPGGRRIAFAADHGQAARLAFADGRPVLLTTGSRNLLPYAEQALLTGVPLAVRVLDTPESLAACRSAGIAADRIIAGRGPFSLAENLAAIGRFGIGVLVTKESGSAGGFQEKLAAAEAAGCRVIVIRRPAIAAAGPVFTSPAGLIAALVSRLPPVLR